jgi:hypothetical protein
MIDKEIINEWFSLLDKGYTIPPYNKEDLKILDEVLEKHGLQKINFPQKYEPIIKEGEALVSENSVDKLVKIFQSVSEQYSHYLYDYLVNAGVTK